MGLMCFKVNFSSLVLVLLIGHCISQNYPVLKDGATATISLLNYNVSDPDGESIEYTYTLLPNTSCQVQLSNIPGDAYFVVVQAHAYFRNVTLSYGPTPTPSTSVSGTNIGLWKAVSLPSVQFSLFYRGDMDNASLMIAAQAYGNQAPVPGGCNMELPIETAPYLTTNYNNDTVTIQFAAASPPPSLMQWLSFASNNACLMKSQDHVMYRAYLPERDFTPELYFSALQRMMTVGRITEAAHAVPSKTGEAPLRRVFAAYPGTGSTYVVVAHTLTASAVYVPTLSYACDARAEEDTCAVLGTTFSKFLCATILFLGLFACFAAHRFFLLETLLLGFLAGGLVFYTALINLTDAPEVLTWSVAGGFLLGISLVILWSFCSQPMLSVLLASTMLGYIVAAILLLPILDYVDAFVSDVNYWITFTCMILVVPAIVMAWQEKANVLATSFLGAYAAIIPVDYYLGSNLRFILLNAIRRATVPGFKWAVIDRPVQTSDILLSFLWALLALAGFATQSILIRNRSPFPAPSHPRRWYRRLRGPSVAAPHERSRLAPANANRQRYLIL